MRSSDARMRSSIDGSLISPTHAPNRIYGWLKTSNKRPHLTANYTVTAAQKKRKQRHTLRTEKSPSLYGSRKLHVLHAHIHPCIHPL
mmetsp:Transcript_45837/g.113934  ORF Transcript_45837/g.113934 Transcript_45837/m.113934 type:complete len:87 (-) Transcript_45837:869-1129(-)